MALRNRFPESNKTVDKHTASHKHKRQFSLEFEKIPKIFIKNYLNQAEEDTNNSKVSPNSYSDFVVVFDSELNHEQSWIDWLLCKGRQFEDLKNWRKEFKSELQQVYKKLTQFGFKVEYCQFSKNTIAYFLTSPKSLILKGYQKSRVEDYLGGMRVNDMEKLFSNDLKDNSVDNFSPSKRLRLIHNLLVMPTASGGCGLSMNCEKSFIKEIYPVHERKFDRSWIKKISTKLYITDEDLDIIKDHSGEQIAYYFAFLQFYTIYLIPISVTGIAIYYTLGSASYTYSLCLLAWSTLFPILWKRKQKNLASRWECLNCSQVERPRSQFKPDNFKFDPVTEHWVPIISPLKFIQRQIKSIPYVMFCSFFLTIFIGLIFISELILTEFYNGPYKEFMVVIPPILGSWFLNSLSSIYSDIAKYLTVRENHPTESKHAFYLTQKVFIMNFLLSYWSTLFTAWFWLPYGEVLIRWINDNLFQVNQFELPGMERVREQVFYLLVTDQLLNHFFETGFPYLMKFLYRFLRKLEIWWYKDKHNSSTKPTLGKNEIVEDCEYSGESCDSSEDEAKLDLDFFKSAKDKFENEYHELEQYDLYEDYCEMAIQFGHIIFFSSIWPLAPLACLANNWLELRTDTIKILFNYKRTVPKRVENIGAWMDHLNLLAWCSSLINPILLYQFKETETTLTNSFNFPIWIILIIIWEHLYFFIDGLYKFIVKLYPTESDLQIRQETYLLKKKMMSQTASDYISQLNSPSSEAELSDSGPGSLGGIINSIDRCVDQMFEINDTEND